MFSRPRTLTRVQPESLCAAPSPESNAHSARMFTGPAAPVFGRNGNALPSDPVRPRLGRSAGTHLSTRTHTRVRVCVCMFTAASTARTTPPGFRGTAVSALSLRHPFALRTSQSGRPNLVTLAAGEGLSDRSVTAARTLGGSEGETEQPGANVARPQDGLAGRRLKPRRAPPAPTPPASERYKCST